MKKASGGKLKRSLSKNQSVSPIQRKKIELVTEKTFDTAGVPFECPRCHWIMRSEKPDSKHPIPSASKPTESSVDNDVVNQNYVCRNPKCQLSFVVYWSDPRDFLRRI